MTCTDEVRSPSSMSTASTPASTYVSPCVIFWITTNVPSPATVSWQPFVCAGVQSESKGSRVSAGRFVLLLAIGNATVWAIPATVSSPAPTQTGAVGKAGSMTAHDPSGQRSESGQSNSTTTKRSCLGAALPRLSSQVYSMTKVIGDVSGLEVSMRSTPLMTNMPLSGVITPSTTSEHFALASVYFVMGNPGLVCIRTTLMSPYTVSVGGLISGGGLGGGGEALFSASGGGLGDSTGAWVNGGGGGGEGYKKAVTLTDVTDRAPVTPTAASMLVKFPTFPGSSRSAVKNTVVGGGIVERKCIVTLNRTPPVCTTSGLSTRIMDAIT
mmetsp:Transcript_36083/g.90033  ORF Transcript_36083/g.90033 Transcript_36083/m.90033 type:complete len:326 (+) Transcript_36083:1452-2429(+)